MIFWLPTFVLIAFAGSTIVYGAALHDVWAAILIISGILWAVVLGRQQHRRL